MNAAEFAAESGIRRLLAEYCHRVDDRDLDGWADLYTEEAVLVPNAEPVCGREAIRAWAHERFADPTRIAKHLIANSVIDVDPASGMATVVSDFTVVMPTQKGVSTVLVGRYMSELVHCESVWRFGRHAIVVSPEWLPTPAES